MRLTNLDLSGRTIAGVPFSYVGECTGTDIKWVGDWRFVSYYKNDFLRPDWSGAQTRHSYSRFNTFTDITASPDVELLDHELIAALLEKGVSSLPRTHRPKAQRLIDALAVDRAQGLYLVSWGNLIPGYVDSFSSRTLAASTFRTLVGGREHLVKHLLNTADSDPAIPSWQEGEPLTVERGVKVSEWGIAAGSRKGRYLRHWSQLPSTNHDRFALAAILEAEILAATGLEITLYVQSILPWRCSVMGGRGDRGRLA